MTPEHRAIPDWAKRERAQDIEWIRENLHIFWPAATDAYAQAGRGAIIVDAAQQPVEGLGHPFGYFAQSFVEERDIEDVKRMVREYDPDNEIVVVMLKSGERFSSYRMQVLDHRSPGSEDTMPL